MKHSVYLTNPFIQSISTLLDPMWHVIRGWELEHLYPKDDISAMATTIWDKIDARFLLQFPNLKLICHLGIGTDNIDTEYLQRNRIQLLSQPHAGIHDTSELALTLMLTLARKIIPNHHYTQSNQWIEKKPRHTGNHLLGKQLGLVGLGKIGQTIAQFAQALGMKIAYTARTSKNTTYAFYEHINELAKISDFLIICCAGGKETQNLVNKEVLDNLGSGGYLINVARGSIVDQDALIHALNHHIIAGAGLDVFPEEPIVPLVLRSLENVVLSPHMGSSTKENLEGMYRLQAQQLNNFLKGYLINQAYSQKI